MPYTPRTSKYLTQSLAARVIARTDLSDLAEGSVLLTMLATVAEELGLSEQRLKTIRDSFFLQTASGAELDERAREMPPAGLQRASVATAQGAILSLWRSDDASEAQIIAGENYPDALTVPAGSIFQRSDDTTQTYLTTVDVVFAGSPGAGLPGEGTISAVYVRAANSGIVGNCATGAIDTVLSAPSEIVSCYNTSGLENGQEEETDEALRARILVYLGSLARCQPVALEYAALSFVSTGGTRARFATVYEDPTNRGYSELVIDDGAGLAGSTVAATAATGTVPETGQAVLYHQAPATAPIAQVTVTRGGVATVYKYNDGAYISLHERGLLYFPLGVLQAGDTWTIDTYDIYTELIQELQRYIEGDTSNPIDFPGWRAAGTRCVVRPAIIEYVSFDLHLIPRDYVALSDVSAEVKTTAIAFFRGLAPGDTFYVSQLVDRLMDNKSIISVRLYEPGTSVFLADHPAASYDKSWRTGTDKISVIPAVEES